MRRKTERSAGKLMASVFWNAHGIIFINYLEKGKNIPINYYIALLERLKKKSQKQSHMVKKNVLFYQENAQYHIKNR